jgi:hypothetical protein
MPASKSIPLADLLVDPDNARLPQEQANQQAALLAVAKEEQGRLVRLATSLREHGLDPLRPVAVRPAPGLAGKYVVVEGNRRLTALKALESPTAVEAALPPGQRKLLASLATKPQKVPTNPVPCLVFSDTELEELDYWVTLLHTGANDGIGLVEWRADEKDRHLARRGRGGLGGQVLEFVRAATGEEYRASSVKGGIISTVQRLVSNPQVRERLGIELKEGRIYTWYPPEETVKGLRRVVDDLFNRRYNSRSLHSVKAREAYAQALSAKSLPSLRTRLSTPVLLSPPPKALAGSAATKKTAKNRSAHIKTRSTLVPKSCHLNVTAARIHRLYIELHDIEVDRFPNLAAVGLRVFTELSVDNWATKRHLLSANDLRNWPLAKRMKTVAGDLRDNHKMPAALYDAVEKVADGGRNLLAASVPTFNLYVHNQYVFPKPDDIRDAWDELQPFLEHLWP